MPRSLVVSAIAVLFLAAACNSATTGGGGGGGGGPLGIAFTVDSADAGQATVTAAGGTVSATGAGGTVYTLTVPAGALATPTQLTVTPLTNVSVNGATASWQVGAQLEPQGLEFLKPVTLGIQLPQASTASAAITLVTADGSRYVPQAPATTGTSFTAELSHFSDYIVGPYSAALLGDAIQALLGSLASPPTTIDLGSSISLWTAAQDPTLNTLRNELAAEIAAEIAGLSQQAQNNTSPTAGFVTGLANAGAQASAAGRTTDASNLDQDALEAFATLVGNIRAALQAAGDFAALDALVNPLAGALGIAQANPTVLVGGVANVESLAQTLVDSIVADADSDCTHAYFTTGTNELLDAIGAVQLLSVTTPSVADLQTDASSCVPPVVTSVTVPPIVAAQAVSDYDTPTTNLYVSRPQTTATVTSGQQTFQATASGTNASATTTATVDVTGGNTVTFSVNGSAQASNPQLSHVAKASALAGGGCPDLTLNIAPVRGDYIVTSSWQVGAAQPPSPTQVASASLQFDNSANPTGSITEHFTGTSYAAGDPVTSTTFDGVATVCVSLAAGVVPGYTQSVSAAVGGTITIQVAPDPNGPKL